MDIKSALAGGTHNAAHLTRDLLPQLLGDFPVKFWWFAQQGQGGYHPHVFQSTFHAASTTRMDGTKVLKRFRHLVAGRRGGKTLSAAWEVLFYALHPREFHRDAHGIESDRALWIWVLAKDYPTGFPSQNTLLEVMAQAGLVKGKDYHYNKTERRIEFIESGTVVQFKTADDPQSLRGAGLDILWIDEAAFIDTVDAWNVVYPALSDKLGLVITTTTPHGKNWLWDEFFHGEAMHDTDQFRVQYTSVDNPYFPQQEWARAKRRYHPVYFRQEYMAAFDAFQGIALQGEWLKYWTAGNPDIQAGELSLKHLRDENGQFRLRTFIGIDPAVSLADNADYFAMAVLGVEHDFSQAYLLDYWLGRIPFHEQLDRIREWQLQWRPELIGVESNAFQRVLAQQAMRLDGFPGIVPVFSKGKKEERILSMAPLFTIGRVRVHRRHGDFIEQWVNFDPEKKNQKDDLLDAVEIAIGVTGALLPNQSLHESLLDHAEPETMESMAKAQLRATRSRANQSYDPEMGSEF